MCSGRSVEEKWVVATVRLRSRRDGSGAANHDASRADCRSGNHSNPKAASSRSDRVRPDGERAAVDG